MQYLKELASSKELLANLVLRDIRGQYKRTILGRLWSLLSPLTAMLVYTFVFSFVFRVKPAIGDPSGLDIFALWLLAGLLPWTFFSGAVSAGMGSLVGNSGLITKVYFPRIVLPLSSVLTVGYNWLFEMLVLAVALLIVGSFLWPWIPLVLLMMIVMILFASGVALMLSVLNVYFRDTQYLVGVVMQIWMYMTPIVYPSSLVAQQSANVGGLFGSPITIMSLYELNPMLHFVAVFRSMLYDNRFPSELDMVACLAWTIVSVVVGFLVFRRNEKGLAETL
jgi:ABC-2 type transport system permease protein